MTANLNKLFTKKQLEVLHYYLTTPFRILILVGAVRAGKTYIDNYIFLYELMRIHKQAKERGIEHPRYILAGATSDTIYKNVISELENQFGITLKVDRHGHYHFMGVDIVPAYTASKTGVASIRGMTSNGAYINELTVANRAVFDEIQNRCSEPGSRIICDTNPDRPNHWVKKELIDNHDPKAGIKSFTFTIDSNTFLDPEYVRSLKASKPRGVFYDRDILGLWATGEGLVYPDFDDKKMVVPDSEIPDDLTYYVGVDWGFAKNHANVLAVWGDDSKGNHYLVDCYAEEGKYIDYWQKRALDVMKRRGYGIPFWCDSARPEYVKAFQDAGINAYNADKKVMAGVEYMSQEIKRGHVKIAQSASKPFLDDIYQYQWDSVKGVPVKEHDNVMDASRYALFTQHKQPENQAYTLQNPF